MNGTALRKPTARRVVGMVAGIVIIALGIALFKQSHLGNDSILKIRNQTNISLRWHYPNQVIGRSSQLPLSLSTSSLFHILPLI